MSKETRTDSFDELFDESEEQEKEMEVEFDHNEWMEEKLNEIDLSDDSPSLQPVQGFPMEVHFGKSVEEFIKYWTLEIRLDQHWKTQEMVINELKKTNKEKK